MTQRRWEKALLLNGLECRAALGGCKLRFVSRSEDVWCSNVRRNSIKRAASALANATVKRQRMASLLEAPPSDPSANALAGLGKPTAVPLPSQHVLKPLEGSF
jgi:hypothetical protein